MKTEFTELETLLAIIKHKGVCTQFNISLYECGSRCPIRPITKHCPSDNEARYIRYQLALKYISENYSEVDIVEALL